LNPSGTLGLHSPDYSEDLSTKRNFERSVKNAAQKPSEIFIAKLPGLAGVFNIGGAPRRFRPSASLSSRMVMLGVLRLGVAYSGSGAAPYTAVSLELAEPALKTG
jgi:hypothetical protein